MNDLLKEIICDLYTYIKEGELIKNGTRYTVDTIIAPLEPELWGYYKELYGENSLTNNHFRIDTEEKRTVGRKRFFCGNCSIMDYDTNA